MAYRLYYFQSMSWVMVCTYSTTW